MYREPEPPRYFPTFDETPRRSYCHTRQGLLRIGQIFAAILTIICTSVGNEFWHHGYQFFWILLTAVLAFCTICTVTVMYCMGIPEVYFRLPWEPMILIANGILVLFYFGSFCLAVWAASVHTRHLTPQGTKFFLINGHLAPQGIKTFF